jgi:hypothetical protein
MAEETNRYHSQNVDRFKGSAKSVKWKDVSAVELKQMLGLFYLWAKFVKKVGMNIGLQTEQLKPQFLHK